MTPQDDGRIDTRALETTRRQLDELKAEIAQLGNASEPIGDLCRHRETAKRLFERADEILAAPHARDRQEV